MKKEELSELLDLLECHIWGIENANQTIQIIRKVFDEYFKERECKCEKINSK